MTKPTQRGMKFGSVCSGIEAASVAWVPLGWEAAFFSEIEPFPCAVLAHHYPEVPNLGDMTKFKEWKHYDIDILVGGTPCQSFSVAGLRKGLDDPRGNLALTYLAIADKYRPRWLAWENVPGVLSSNAGRDFGSFLGGLAELGYGFAYRVFDAQYFELPQRRSRVFVVGHSGDWRRAAAVLFEHHSLQGHNPPSREARQEIAGTLDASSARNRGAGTNPGMITFGDEKTGGQIARCLTTRPGMRNDGESDSFVVYGIEIGPAGGRFSDLSPTLDARSKDGPIRNQLSGAVISYGIDNNRNANEGFINALMANTGGAPEVVASFKGNASAAAGLAYSEEITPTLIARSDQIQLMQGAQIRRFTPLECERLQGFPDNYTLIPYRKKQAADAPRYKAIGNSMPVPVMRWIGERIESVDKILEAA